ncbi:MAG: aldehyde ferredoxin oxidoreductase [Anaerolineales bacterium]|nr:aldehyde ferredoxin oxidoreductase [Anaerolineales bacterium]
MKIWRINIQSKQHFIEDVPEGWQHLGGRGLLAKIMLDEVIPTCDPLGPNNKLVFAPGLLVGHRLSSLDRISIGGKSPLTGGIKEANAGGRTGYHLTQLGIKALIIEGRPEKSEWKIIHLSKAGVRFDEADGILGNGVYQSAETLTERYGEDVAIALIGPGGEMKLRAAGIQNIDLDKSPSRIAARGGMGAVMGSKGIKAIVIDTDGGQQPSITNELAFKDARKRFTTALINHPQTTSYADYGTAAMANMCNGFGGLPTRNFSEGTFEHVEKIGGEQLRSTLLERGGVAKTTHACMAGCAIRCSNVYSDKSGSQVVVAPVEYETIGLMGSNLGIDSLDVIAQMNREANDLGLDSIEIGAALGVACEAGLMSFGDGKRALELIAEIRAKTPLGRILGNGAAATGLVFGIERVPVVKGQAISAYDPRAIKGMGVTYATAPQGADHTCGMTIRAKIKHTQPHGQVEKSKEAQLKMAGYDTLGACIFSGFGFAQVPETIYELVNARYGTDHDIGLLQELGRETIAYEREFNRRAGFTKSDDRLPEWMTREPLPPHNTVFDVPDEELDSIFDE